MCDSAEKKKGALRPDFNRRIRLDFQGARLSSDTGFLRPREIYKRCGVIEAVGDSFADNRSASHTQAFNRPDDSAACLSDGRRL